MSEKPRLAATVILLRDTGQRGLEIFLTRRPEGMAFLGGKYCFPGGTLRKEDYSRAMLQRCTGLTPDQAQEFIGAEVGPRVALGVWVAALRELFEEAGILLGLDRTGRRMPDDARERLIEKHSRLSSALTFAGLLESEGVFCDLGALAHFSHWQTPEQVSMRYDTHFFLAELPVHQSPLPVTAEVSHSLWLSPDDALRMNAKNQLPVIFPTFASLRALADFDSLESVWREFRRDKSPLRQFSKER
ncbi:MAG TPA: NUDIX domain-containing protein [Candidatus Binatia bacterium]|nr:NUDIX domain-containing protein [Candidatus Binatia bacterium]